MHELSIAAAIVAVAEENAAGRRVAKVEVKIGHLRQVVPSALELSFEVLTEGTAMDGSELVIEDIPARVACRECAREGQATEFPLACANCGSLDVDVLSGDELFVDSLELEDTSEPVVAGRS